MAKLPDIQYMSPTETLGRQDVGLPGRLARQQMALTAAVGDIVFDFTDTIMQQQVGEGVAGSQSELSQLKDTLMRDRVVDVDRFDLAEGVDYNPVDVNGEPVSSISSHTVMEKQWTQGVKDIVGKYTAGMSPGQRKAVGAKLAGSIDKMGGMVSGQAHKWRLEEINAVTEEQANTLINSATFEIKDEVKMQVTSLYNDKVKSGFMGPEEGMKKARIAREKVDYNVMLMEIQDGGQTQLDQMEEALSRPGVETGLEVTLEQRKVLYGRLDARQIRLERNREKIEKAERERKTNDMLIDIQENGAKEWPTVRGLVRDLTPSDGRLLIKLNEAKLSEQAEEDHDSDDGRMGDIEKDVLAISMGRTRGVSPQQMVDALTNKLYDAVDDWTNGKPGIKPADATAMLARIKDAARSAPKPIGYEDAREMLSMWITRGSIANLGQGNRGPQALKLYESFIDLDQAIQAGMKDPKAWVENNKNNYTAATTAKNMTKADRAVADRYGVTVAAGGVPRPEGAPSWDLGATLERARGEFDAGLISEDTYQMVVDYWRSKQAAHMQMLGERAKRLNE